MKFATSTKQPEQTSTNYTIARLASRENTQVYVHEDGRTVIECATGSQKKSPEDLTHHEFFRIARQLIQTAKHHRITKLAIRAEEWLFPTSDTDERERAALFAQNAEMANYAFREFKSQPDHGKREVKEVLLCEAQGKAIKEGLAKGKLIGEEVNNARSLANTPGGDMTPEILADRARKAIKDTTAKATVLSKKSMERKGMGAVLGVAQGSANEPRFIILEYNGGAKDEQPIVFVGKGVTFDTGGINLKPSDAIADMYMDMSGGAAVIHAVALAARRGIKKNVVALVPAVENMPSGASYRPADILKTLSGKTVEVLNTDAEGRLIMADALTYAERYKPRLVVDVATLTGAAIIALGHHASAIMTHERELEDTFRRYGQESGDYVWPLPLWKEYGENLKGTFADLANIPTQDARAGGTIAAGMFLSEFAQNYPWVHIDIASRMHATSNDALEKGSPGTPVRLLHKLIEEY